MQRRQFLRSTSVALAATLSGCGGGGESGVAAQNNTAAPPAPTPAPAPAPAPAAAPPPPPAGGFLDVPSQLNEQQMYDNVLGWTWSASDKATTFGANPGPQSHNSITDDSEGDDLWSHYQAYKRTGNPIYLQWAQRWRDYFVNNYYDQWAAGDGQEHTYGQGLALWGLERNDGAALAALERIATRIEALAPPPGHPMQYYGARHRARHLLVATYQSYANPIARWINLRDLLVLRWFQSPGWEDTTNSPLVAGGHYFADRVNEDNPGFGSYDAGYRIHNSFMMALLAEAFWRVYQLTARTDIRARLIQMAYFIKHYANNPNVVNAMSGGWWGHFAGTWHHPSTNTGNTNPNISTNNAAYETCHVNQLVIGYKLTGDPTLLARAKIHFRKGSQYDDWGSGGAPKHPDNLVHHYVDTHTDPGGNLFGYNKGELQYNYLIFENGGVPTVKA